MQKLVKNKKIKNIKKVKLEKFRNKVKEKREIDKTGWCKRNMK